MKVSCLLKSGARPCKRYSRRRKSISSRRKRVSAIWNRCSLPRAWRLPERPPMRAASGTTTSERRRAYQRYKMLLEEGATPRLTFEKAQKEYIALQAESKNLDAVAVAADERISSVSRELDAARKILEGKATDAEAAKLHAGSGEVLSPVNGIVVARRGQAGDDVHPSMTDLFQIASDISVLQAVADASPAQISKIKQGQPATVTLAEMGGELLQGTVLKAENGKVTVEFANPNALVKPGLTAQIRIKLT